MNEINKRIIGEIVQEANACGSSIERVVKSIENNGGVVSNAVKTALGLMSSEN